MPRAMPALHAVVSPDVSACGSPVLPQTTLRCSVLSSILPVGVLNCPFQSSSVCLASFQSYSFSLAMTRSSQVRLFR